MTPPIQCGLSEKPQIDAPLSKWVIQSAFDTADDCNAAHSALLAEGDRDSMKHEHGTLEWAVAITFMQSQCVATDDPRLKETK